MRELVQGPPPSPFIQTHQLLGCACNNKAVVVLRGTHPNVYFWPRVLLSLKHLGGGVGRRAAPRGEKLTPLVEVGEAKVGNLDIHARVQQQIFGLEEREGTEAVLQSCYPVNCLLVGSVSHL